MQYGIQIYVNHTRYEIPNILQSTNTQIERQAKKLMYMHLGKVNVVQKILLCQILKAILHKFNSVKN